MTYFTFSRALHLMKNSGAKVRRASWSNKKMYYYLSGDNFKWHDTDSYQNGNLDYLTADEILANDWEVYDD